jgi:hypothetical protein
MKRTPNDLRGPDIPGGVVEFRTPHVSPDVKSPQARQYAAEVARRHPQQQRYAAPAGGPSAPPIPRLDQPAASGSTMADQANMQRAGSLPGQPALQGAMFQGAPVPGAAQITAGLPRHSSGILPSDLLPNEAREDPNFRDGHGSMYAASQPDLAFKYGVVRGGERIPPQKLRQVKQGLSDKTVESLKALEDMQAKRQKAESSDAQIEREAAASAAGAAGRLGNSPTDGPRADPEVTKEKITEAVKNLDDFDFNTFREMMMKDIINNADQQKIIESRCKAMDVSDLIVNGFVTQKVPIIPGKFEPEFRSMSGAEDLAIKRLIMLEGKGAEVSDRYLLDKFSMMAVVVGIHALNNNPLPSHLDKDGTFDDDAFWKKFNMVVRYPFHLLASLGVNYFWFEIRVRQLFVAEKLGNG